MQNIPDRSVDMILCDPPYGTTQNKWDIAININKMFAQYRRVIKIGGVIALFSQPPINAELMQAARDIFRYEWIWEKEQGTGHLNANRMPLKIHENILIFYDKLGIYNPQYSEGKAYTAKCSTHSGNYGKQKDNIVTVNGGYRYPTDIIKFGKDAHKIHPTQKPVPLLEYLVKTYTNEGETVLDNCMGSGSTGIACINTDRNFIGIELDDNYFEIAKKRISGHIKGTKETKEKSIDENQLTLF